MYVFMYECMLMRLAFFMGTKDFQSKLDFVVWLLLISLLLDIVQSFPLLSYCIVSPIYISPICNV